MPPTLRQTTRKAAVLLPQNARFAFLAEASSLMSATTGGVSLARHLGVAALKVGGRKCCPAAMQHAKLHLCTVNRWLITQMPLWLRDQPCSSVQNAGFTLTATACRGQWRCFSNWTTGSFFPCMGTRHLLDICSRVAQQGPL